MHKKLLLSLVVSETTIHHNNLKTITLVYFIHTPGH